MGLITDIKEQKRHQGRLSVFVDGRFALGMSRDLLFKMGLAVGQQISEDRLCQLEAVAALEAAMSVATRYLAYRPRSERELRSRLRRRGIDDGTVERAVEKLMEQGLLNDQTFAQFWKDQRVTFRPRSRRLLEQELKLKGIDREIIGEIVADLDDEAEAYRAGLKKARTLPRADYQTFCKKIITYLRGRGFSYSTASKTARGIWSEADEGLEDT